MARETVSVASQVVAGRYQTFGEDECAEDLVDLGERP